MNIKPLKNGRQKKNRKRKKKEQQFNATPFFISFLLHADYITQHHVSVIDGLTHKRE
jgi:hypothetical protein